MIAPRPRSLRLLARPGARAPRPPLGLAEWSPDGEAVAVLLDGAVGPLDDVDVVAGQIPGADEVPAGTLVIVLGVAASHGTMWRRLIAGSPPAVARSIRCSALLARGYTAIGGGLDEAPAADLAWGVAPRSAGTSVS